MQKLPHRQQLMHAVYDAISALGGSGSLDEIREQVIASLGIPEKLASEKHRSKRGEEQRTQLEYDLAWARTALKEMGYLENSSRGVWALVSPPKVLQRDIVVPKPDEQMIEDEIAESGWRDQLLKLLREKLTPAAFEHLIQRVLRETGFSSVVVTGRSGDGGVDGKGIARINGILSFHVVFQCKRIRGSVSPSLIRDFRGAAAGRADKGLFITTGTFTREAVKEATREGAMAIDLVDGLHLCEKLRELRLGLRIEQVERIHIDDDWFTAFNHVS